jgi:hypothetical protein
VPESPTQRWLDDVLDVYMRDRPVNATFIGVHDHDHALPDLTEGGMGDVAARMEGHLARARRLEGERGSEADGDPPRVDPVEAVDRSLAEGFLRISLWEHGSGHHQRGNPTWATGEAVFGVLSLFLSDFGPLEVRADSAVRRLEGIPGFLAHARRWLQGGPGSHPRWTARALDECDGALAFLGDGLELLAHTVEETGTPSAPALAGALRRAGSRAAAAFTEHRVWLETEHLRHAREDVACGPEILDLHIREGHHLPESAGEIARYAREEMLRVRGEIEELVATLGAGSFHDVLDRLRRRHPDADGYLERYREIWETCREIALDRNLVTWPDDPIRYRPRPRWARAVAPHLYFLFYRSPAAFHRPPVHEYLVAPLPEGEDGGPPDPEVLEAFLEAHHDYVIKTNHVIHHGGVGHHVQNGHAFRGPSRIGRIAAVDCAARIAMHCGGTMAEGWACYATELMAEHGALDPLEVVAERASRIRMCCRAVVDVELHSGRMSLEDAARFYRREAGMPESASWSEAVKNSMFPGGALMYLMGTDGIRALRKDMEATRGDAFDLPAFHDGLLANGSIPVTLAGTLLRSGSSRAGARA